MSRDVYTVSRLNREVRASIEGNFGAQWVAGEISNLARPASGHLYFSLKDPSAQARCAMFRLRSGQLRFRPSDGMQVLAYARISFYEPRGEFQLVVEHLEPAGEGLLRLRFEALKQKLAAEGLFDTARKRPLPTWPKAIGVVTSATGAAVRDILQVLARRNPSIPVFVYPCAVQGVAAVGEIVAAIAAANRRAECQVLIVARGGGSLEDLWSFNEEAVVRAISASVLPTICGIGHEIDFSLADFAADVRAPTPSAAAEISARACRGASSVRCATTPPQHHAHPHTDAKSSALKRRARTSGSSWSAHRTTPPTLRRVAAPSPPRVATHLATETNSSCGRERRTDKREPCAPTGAGPCTRTRHAAATGQHAASVAPTFASSPNGGPTHATRGKSCSNSRTWLRHRDARQRPNRPRRGPSDNR